MYQIFILIQKSLLVNLKTFNIMNNIRIIFQSTKESELKTNLECVVKNDEICLISKLDGVPEERIVSLDVPSAIKFSKILRSNINILKNGGNNG